MVKNSFANAGDAGVVGSIPGLGRSPGGVKKRKKKGIYLFVFSIFIPTFTRLTNSKMPKQTLLILY